MKRLSEIGIGVSVVIKEFENDDIFLKAYGNGIRAR